MKKYIIWILLLLVSFNAYCQKRNANGQKAVYQVVAYYKQNKNPIFSFSFKYNSKNELIGIFYKEKERTMRWSMAKDRLIRIQYDNKGNVNKNYHYSYTIGSNNLISEMIKDCVGIDGSHLITRYYYNYDKTSRLYESNQRVFYYDERGKGRELSDRYMQYYVWDDNGNIFYSRLGGYQWKIQEKYNMDIMWTAFDYTDIVNDTNIDFLYLVETGKTELFEMATEWIDCHSKYLIKRYSSFLYEYTFDNSNNITQCRVYEGWSEKERELIYTINLSYLI